MAIRHARRRPTVVGAVITAIALGLREVFESRHEERAAY